MADMGERTSWLEWVQWVVAFATGTVAWGLIFGWHRAYLGGGILAAFWAVGGLILLARRAQRTKPDRN